MKKFVTPEGIEQRGHSYYTSCDCIGKEHGVSLWLDTEYGLSLVMDCEVYPRNFWKRLKTVVRLLFIGYVESCGEFVFRDKQHVRDMALVLNHLADEMEK